MMLLIDVRRVPYLAGAALCALLAGLGGCSSSTEPAQRVVPSGMYRLASVGRVLIPGLVIDTLPSPNPNFPDSIFSGSLTFDTPDTVTFVQLGRSWSPDSGWHPMRASDTTHVPYASDSSGTITLTEHFVGATGQDTVLAIPVAVANKADSLTFSLPYGLCEGTGASMRCLTRWKELIYTR